MKLIDIQRCRGDFSGAMQLLDVDPVRRLFCVAWVTDRIGDAPGEGDSNPIGQEMPMPSFFLEGGRPISPVYSRSYFGVLPDTPPLGFHLLWFAVGGTDGVFYATQNGNPVMIHLDGGKTAKSLDSGVLNRLRRPFFGARSDSIPLFLYKALDPQMHLAYLLSRRQKYKARFGGCWLFADRANLADDNAEHLYRWVASHHPEHNIHFALHPESRDWNRLSSEGFRLLDISGLDYDCAQFHAAWVIASNLNGYITRFKWRYWYPGSIRSQLAFLQHGIIKDYLYRMGRLPLDLFLTSAEREYDSLAKDPDFPYPFSAREIRLTGLPRHDALLRKVREASFAPNVLIIPTWRESLTGAPLFSGSVGYRYNPDFKRSRFFREWLSVLKNESLRAAVKALGGRVLLWPHPNMAQQCGDFEKEGVEIASYGDSGIQSAIAEASLMITDYSSLAIEAALVGKPVLYFQFDKERFNSSYHTYLPGYYDYERDGFGEIAVNSDGLIRLALAQLAAKEVPAVYKERARRFFAFHDENNCERAYNAIIEASGPFGISAGA